MAKPKTNDEALLARVRKEETEHGLVLGPSVDEEQFHRTMTRLIHEPPLPKRERKKPKRHSQRASQATR